MSKRREREPNSSVSSQESSPISKSCKMADQEHVEGKNIDSKEPTLEMIYTKLMNVEENTVRLINDYAELKRNHEQLKQSFDVQSVKITELQADLLEQRELGKVTTREISVLMSRVSQLEENEDEISQYQRKYNLEIHGVPECDDEDLGEIVEEIAKEVKVEVESDDIDIVHRQHSKIKPRPILVKFKCYDDKKSLYEARWRLRRYKGDDEKLNGAQKIFLNEHLTFERKKLYAQARKRAKQCKLASVQTRDGKIFIKKEKGGTTYKITKQVDFEELFI